MDNNRMNTNGTVFLRQHPEGLREHQSARVPAVHCPDGSDMDLIIYLDREV